MTLTPNILINGSFSPDGANHLIAACKKIEKNLNTMLQKQNVISENDIVYIQGFSHVPYAPGLSLHADVFNISTTKVSRPSQVMEHVLDQLRWYGYLPEYVEI
jgi:hypothetical protein